MKKVREKLNAKLRKSGGFTLVEMLIVVAIIAILVAVSIPLVNGALDKAREATDAANLRAAKAEGAILYLSTMADTGWNETANKDYYYDIDDGKLVAGTYSGTGYGKVSGNEWIKVTIATTGDVTAEWQ